MKLQTGTGEADFELIPENEVVNVRLQDVELHTFEWKDETVEKLNWFFIVTDPGPWEGKEIRGESSSNFTAHPNCKAYNWVTTMTGKKYANGEELDTDDLMGTPCRIIIKHKTDNQGRIWMRVREVLPARGVIEGTADASTAPDEAPF